MEIMAEGTKVIVFALQIQIACEHSDNITEMLALHMLYACIQIACVCFNFPSIFFAHTAYQDVFFSVVISDKCSKKM